jgi:geranylgeranyl diphosphate synthase, type I
VRRDVDASLVALFEEKIDNSESLGADVGAMIEAVRDLTMRGGKRLRPALLVAAYRGVAPDASPTAAIRAGAAFELLQTYLLIHDDWMDKDEVRRGGAAVHVVLAQHHGSRHAGDAAAVLAGDFASALALETLSMLDAPADRITRCVALFAQIQQDVTRGQQIDLAAHPHNIEVMHDLKSGSYSVRGPVMIGAALAGANLQLVLSLERFAKPLGIAFQLRDDLIGVFGDPDETGKPSGSDIRSGKHTALVAEALARANPGDQRTLKSTIGHRTATARDVRSVVEIFERSGARAAVEHRIDALACAAEDALGDVDLSEPGSEWLAGAIVALTNRRL